MITTLLSSCTRAPTLLARVQLEICRSATMIALVLLGIDANSTVSAQADGSITLPMIESADPQNLYSDESGWLYVHRTSGEASHMNSYLFGLGATAVTLHRDGFSITDGGRYLKGPHPYPKTTEPLKVLAGLNSISSRLAPAEIGELIIGLLENKILIAKIWNRLLETNMGDLEIQARRQGVDNYDLILERASAGDEASIDIVLDLRTDGAGSESQAILLEQLLSKVGDKTFAARLRTRPRDTQKKVLFLMTSAWSPPSDHLRCAGRSLAHHSETQTIFRREFGPEILCDRLIFPSNNSRWTEVDGVLDGYAVSDSGKIRRQLQSATAFGKIGELIGIDQVGAIERPSFTTLRYAITSHDEGSERSWVAFRFHHADSGFALVSIEIVE